MSDNENVEDKRQEVTVDELSVLKEQIKKKDEEARALEEALQQERRARQETGAKLSEEVTTRFSAQETAIESQIMAATAEIDTLEKQQTELMEAGKFAEANKINRLIAAAVNRQSQAEAQKAQFNQYKQAEAAKIEAAKNDPLAGYSDPAKRWIQKNPAFLNDRKINAKVLAAHNLAVADDIEVDSPEYFNRLDEAINPKVTVENKNDADADTQTTRTQSRSSTGSPVTRQSPTNNAKPNNNNRIQLTAEQAEAAIISFPKLSPQDAYVKYHENLQKLKEMGKM